MKILDNLKQAGSNVLNGAIQPFLEKPKKRITWHAYHKWRTLVNNDGQVSLRRYDKQPHDAYVVGSSLEAIDRASEEWDLEIDSRGRIATPVVASPVFHREPVNLERYRPIRITAPRVRITPRVPRLCR